MTRATGTQSAPLTQIVSYKCLTACYEHEVAAHFTDGIVKSLVLSEQTADEETKAEAEQQVGEDASENGGLDDAHALVAVMLDQDHEQDDLDQRPKGGLEDDTKHLRQLAGQFLSGKPQQVRRRHHCDV